MAREVNQKCIECSNTSYYAIVGSTHNRSNNNIANNQDSQDSRDSASCLTIPKRMNKVQTALKIQRKVRIGNDVYYQTIN